MPTLRTLRQCLIDTELAHLRVIAHLWRLDVRSQRPLEIAAELSQYLSDPSNATVAWEMLADAERAALRALLDAGGMLPAAAFKRRFGEIRPTGPGRLEREQPWREPISPAEGLWYRGLIYEGFADEAVGSYSIYFVPPELQAALPVKAVPGAPRLRLQPAGAPRHHHAASDLLLDDLTTILAFAHNQVVRPQADSAPAWPEQTRQRLLRDLRDPDPRRLDFTLHLIAHLGWLRTGRGGRVRLAAEPVTTWLRQPALDVLIEGWLRMSEWDELWSLTTLQPDEAGTWRHDPTLARAALLRHLEELGTAEWFSLTEYIDAVKADDPDFQRPEGDYDIWYVRDGSTGAYLRGFESWERVEGSLLRSLLMGPAFWLGLVELGGETPGRVPEVFRRRAIAGPQGALELPSPAVRSDLTIAMPALRPFERFQLSRVADLTAVGDLYLYRLTPASLSRARRQGIPVEKLLTFLESLSDAPLLPVVRASLDRWDAQGTEVRLERTILLRVTTEAVMKQVMASPKASRHVERIIGPTHAVVKEQDLPRFVSALAELGLLAELVGLKSV